MATPAPKKLKALPTLGIRRSDDTSIMRAMTEGLGHGPQSQGQPSGVPIHSPNVIGEISGADSLTETRWVEGATNVDAPLNLIIDSEWNSRVFYPTHEIDDLAQGLLRDGQKENAKGYLVTDEAGKVVKIGLLSGHKRLRAARAAGMATLRLDIVARPADALAAYLACRVYNSNRSDETALDNAVRWAGLLKDGKVGSQQELAKILNIADSEVSMVLGINRIPNRVLLHMKDRPRACAKSIAYLVSGMFAEGAVAVQGTTDLEYAAIEVVDAIQAQELGRTEVKRLIESKTTPARQRMRAEVREVNFCGKKGALKIFKAKGQLAFDIKGLEEAQLIDLERRITAIVGDQQALFGAAK